MTRRADGRISWLATRWLATVVACVLVASTLVAAPAFAREAAQRSDRLQRRGALADLALADLGHVIPEAVTTDGGGPEQRRADAMPGGVDVRSASGLVRAVGRAMPLVSGMPAVAVATKGSGDSDDPDDPGGFSDVFAVGDVDGDGRDDVAVIDVALADQSFALRVLGGVDGVELAHRPLPYDGVVAFPHQDLTGDGGADVLLLELIRFEVLEDDCSSARWCARFHAEWIWRVTVASGADLVAAWSLEFDGHIDERSDETIDGLRRREERQREVRGAWSWLGIVERASATVVLVDRVDVDEHEATEGWVVPVLLEERRTSSMRSTHHVSMHGPTGAPLIEAQVGPVPGQAFLAPVGDLTGDGATDLLLEEFVRGDGDRTCRQLVVEQSCSGTAPSVAHGSALLSGITLERVWTHATDGDYGFAYPLRGDVDGDGVPDVVHRWARWGATIDDDKLFTAVVSGADGRRLWTLDGYLVIGVLGEVDGDDVDDVVEITFHYPPEWPQDGTIRLVLTRRSGLNGETLFATEHPYELSEEYDEFGYAYLPDDLDGDGVRDLIVGRARVPCADGLCDETRVESSAVVESGATGSALWEVPGARGYTFLLPMGDVDADELLDLGWAHGQDGTSRLEVFRGGDGQSLWSRDITTEYAYLTPLGEVDGEPGADLGLVYDTRDGHKLMSHIAALNGASGHLLWHTP